MSGSTTGGGSTESGGILRSELPSRSHPCTAGEDRPKAAHPEGAAPSPDWVRPPHPAGSDQPRWAAPCTAHIRPPVTRSGCGSARVVPWCSRSRKPPSQAQPPSLGSRRGGSSGLWWSTAFRAGTTGSPVSLAASLRRALSAFRKQ